MAMNRFFLFWSTLLVAAPLVAQVIQPKRVELILTKGDDYYTLVSAEENGIVLFRETENLDKANGFEWEFIKLDTGLVEEWRFNRAIGLRYEFMGYDYFDNHLFVLFGIGEYKIEDYKNKCKNIAD